MATQIPQEWNRGKHLMGADTPQAGRQPEAWLDAVPDEALRQIAAAWDSLSEVQKEIISASVATFLQANEGRQQ